MVEDPAVKVDLQAQMLKLVKTPVPQCNVVESQLHGSSATNPVVVDSDSDDAREEDFEEDGIQLDSDEGGVVKVKDGTELAEKDSVVEGVYASTWANQVTLNPNPNPNPQPTTPNITGVG